MKRLRKAVRDYLTMRRGLGFKMARHEVGLQDFVSFLGGKRSTLWVDNSPPNNEINRLRNYLPQRPTRVTSC